MINQGIIPISKKVHVFLKHPVYLYKSLGLASTLEVKVDHYSVLPFICAALLAFCIARHTILMVCSSSPLYVCLSVHLSDFMLSLCTAINIFCFYCLLASFNILKIVPGNGNAVTENNSSDEEAKIQVVQNRVL